MIVTVGEYLDQQSSRTDSKWSTTIRTSMEMHTKLTLKLIDGMCC
jgi:hypothetical protein